MEEVDLYKVLQKYFGFSTFRNSQLAAIQAALKGQDCFVLLPTGGGKSLCFCLPALVKAGLVLVVSPLIALMENQVEGLKAKQIPADLLSSQRSAQDRSSILADVQSSRPRLRLLFVTPELIATDSFAGVLKTIHANQNLSLFAIDEAHWGHDFRYAYRKLSVLRKLFPRIPIMALTATATPKVQLDITKSLNLRDPVSLVSSFDRPNIHFSVWPVKAAEEAAPAIAKLLRGAGEPCAIVYALKRDTADDVALRLKAAGVSCQAYHAGLRDADRSKVLADWTSGRVSVVAATVAFGMGIDKADVRFVFHVNLPKTMEAFYQEAGRAGRDGLPAKSLCFYKESDRERMTYILEGQTKGKGRKRVRSEDRVESAPELAVRAFNRVVAYCTEPKCRRAMLLGHFGEVLARGPCSGCDYCDDPAAAASRLAALASDRGSLGATQQAKSRKRLGGQSVGGYGFEHDITEEEEESDSGSDVVELNEHEAAAERTAKQARTQGSEAVFAALQQAEAESESKDRKETTQLSRSSRRTASVELPARISVGAPPVAAEVRAAAQARILKALHASACCAEAHHLDLEAAAQAVEAGCFASSASKAVYLGKLAAAVRSAALVLPVQLEADFLAKGDRDESRPKLAAPSGSRTADLDAAVRDIEEMVKSGCGDTSGKAAERLHELTQLQVTAEQLKHAKIGKRVRILSKCAAPIAAAAAKEVIVAWKAQLLRHD